VYKKRKRLLLRLLSMRLQQEKLSPLCQSCHQLRHHGGVTRARKLAEFLKAPIAIIDKRRPKANVAEVL
jgi:hypothetical protein